MTEAKYIIRLAILVAAFAFFIKIPDPVGIRALCIALVIEGYLCGGDN